MHFKRFLDFKTNNLNKKLIIFNNNKIIFDKDINNFILDYPYLNIDIDNSIYVGIGESEDSIYYAVWTTTAMRSWWAPAWPGWWPRRNWRTPANRC